MAKNDRDLDNVVLSLRLRGADAARFWRVMDNVKAKNPYADRSDVLRELLGLSEPELISPDDLVFFRTGEKAGSGQPKKNHAPQTIESTKPTGAKLNFSGKTYKTDAEREVLLEAEMDKAIEENQKRWSEEDAKKNKDG